MEFPPGGGFPPSLVQSGLTLTDLASRGKTSPAENSFYRTVRETCIMIPLVRVGFQPCRQASAMEIPSLRALRIEILSG